LAKLTSRVLPLAKRRLEAREFPFEAEAEDANLKKRHPKSNLWATFGMSQLACTLLNAYP